MIRYWHSLGAQRLRPVGLVGKTVWKRERRATKTRRQVCAALPGLMRALFLFGIGFGLFITLALISPTILSARGRLRHALSNSQDTLALERSESGAVRDDPGGASPPVSSVVTSQDTQANVANQLLAEAERLRIAGTVDSRRAAIEKYKASLPLWRSLGDRSKEATVRHSLCSTHNALGERQIALGYCEQALAVRRELSDQRGEAETLNVIGNIQLALHGPQSALGYFQRALSLRRALGDQRGITVTLGNLARLYAQMGDNEKELEALREALPLSQAIGDKALENNFLGMMGNLYNRLGELEMAFSYFQQSLSLSRERNDKVNEAGTLSNLGKLYYEIGEKQQALSLLTDAIALHRLNGNRVAEGATLTTIAGLWLSLGETDKASNACEESLKLAQESGSGNEEFFALQTLSGIYRTLSNNQKALEYDQAAFSLARLRNSKPGQAISLSSIAIDWLGLNDLPKALEYQRQAITLHRETSNQTQLIVALLELCGAQIKQGDYAAATAACRESLDLSRDRRDRESQANALSQLASIATGKGNSAQACDLLEEVMRLIEATSSEIIGADTRASYLGFKHRLYADYVELLMKQHRNATSAGHAHQAFQVVEHIRARSLVTLLAEARADIRQGTDPALREREKGLLKKLEVKAVGQNRLRESNTNQARLDTIAREIDELSTELGLVRAQMVTSSPRYAALTQPQPLNLDDIQKEVVVGADTLLLEYALGEEQSYLWAITATSFHSYELPKREVIEQTAQRVYDLLTARNQSVNFETAEERPARIKKADAEFQTAAAALSRMILTPVAAELRGQRPKQLLIVADGKLQYVPFVALPVPAARVGKGASKTNPQSAIRNPQSYVPLVAKYEIVNLPSASTLAVLRRELKDRSLAPKTLAVFADPVFEAEDERVPKEVRDRLARERQMPTPEKEPAAKAVLAADELTRAMRDVGLDGERGGLKRLPYTRDEANAILAFAPEAGRFSALDFDANQDAALNPDLSQYRYVHFATHGLIDNATPELSGLVLSRLDAQGRELDGHLRMVEIYNMNLPAELVVLSACKTGLGKEVRGEGLMSLTRGFMFAGAARVVVSLWDVNDKSTASLMGEFYGGLLQRGLRPSAALREAQLKMLKSRQWAAPYYWAAFVQHGEPR